MTEHAPARVTRLIKRERAKRDGVFEVYLDGEQLLTTRRPLTDGARALLARGYNPNLPLAVRAENRNYDSFKPITIGEAAKWTVSEEDKGGLRLRPWKPHYRSGETGGNDRTGASSENGHSGTPEEDGALRDDRPARHPAHQTDRPETDRAGDRKAA